MATPYVRARSSVLKGVALSVLESVAAAPSVGEGHAKGASVFCAALLTFRRIVSYSVTTTINAAGIHPRKH